MQQQTKWTTLAGLIALSLQVSSAHAEDDFRDHEAHVHGHVELNIAQDGQELLFEISAPGADVVGFEHPPETDAEKQALAKAVALLEQPQQLISLSGNASCELEFKSVKHTLSDSHHDEHDDAEHHDEHEHHQDKHDDAEHHDKHDDHHDKHDDAEHHDEHDHDSEAHGQHGSFTVEYHYQCGDITKLTEFQTSWFNAFPSTESIEVNLLTDTKQTALELSPKNTKFNF
ncbi:zinc uptake protein ZrgA [Vibrio cortegadensis]|uniref:zinc uptake protein ZrgA n=1 Tax=Vibrio cortegadensis TaxID=1328770 RepID=UPI00352F83FA